MNIGIVIPAYNTGEGLRTVLSKSLKFVPKERLFVVDDGSTDATADVAASLGVTLFRHAENRGKGEALKCGFKEALKHNLCGVITLDGDGQHDPAFIPDFISIMESQNCDLVLGTRRYCIGEMPFDRICSNRLSSLIVSAVSGKWIPDTQCGYRLIRSDVLKNVSLFSSRFELESELLIKAVKQGFTFAPCPITVPYRNTGSHIRRFQDTMRFCRMILKLIFKMEKK